MHNWYIQAAMGKYDRRVIFRASEMDYIRWRADALRGGSQSFGEWARKCLNEAGGRLPAERVEEKTERAYPYFVRDKVAKVGSGRVKTVESSAFEQGQATARALAQRAGRCTADVERGVRCRLCGKHH